MSEDLENIQAKLCAYLEGELDSGERAQIEKHLAANPNDRRLVEEMARARQMMRQLPRQSAPPDVAEAIQRQLERSVLLDGDGGSDPAVIGRIGRWPQYAAVAAILLLAVGLGAVVYYVVLPPTGGPVAIVQKPAAAPLTGDGQAPVVIGGEEAGGGVAPAEADAASRRAARERRRAAAAFAAKGGAPHTMAKASPAAPQLSGDAKDLPPAPQAALNQATAAPAGIADAAATGPSGYAWAVKAKTGDADRLVLVVSTDNPTFANSQVVQYLTSNNIAWDVAPPTTDGAAVTDEQRATLPQNAQQMSREIEQVPGGGVGAAAVADDDDAAQQTQQITQAQIQRQLVDPYADDQALLGAQQQQQQQQFQNLPEAAQESPRQQQPRQQLHEESEQVEGLAQQQAVRQQAKAKGDQPAEGQLQPAAPPMVQQALPEAQAFAANRPAAAVVMENANAARREQVIVARGMRRSQAIELRDALTAAGQNAGPQQRVLAYLAADGAPRSEALPGQQPLAGQPLEEAGQQHVATTAPLARTNGQPAAPASGPPAPADAEKRFPNPLNTDAVIERSGGAGRKTEGASVAGTSAAGAAMPPTTGPADLRVAETVSPGDLLSIEIGGPTPTSTLRVQVAPVWSDGTATLPWLGRQAVAGKTVGELQQQLSNARRTGDGAAATGAQAPGRVFVRRIGPSASAQRAPAAPAAPAGPASAAPRVDRAVPPALPPASLPLIAQRPQQEELTTATTRPATTPASQPAAAQGPSVELPPPAGDAPVDVVIVVQDAPVPAPAPAESDVAPPQQQQQDPQAIAPDPAAADAPATAPAAAPAAPAAPQPAQNP